MSASRSYDSSSFASSIRTALTSSVTFSSSPNAMGISGRAEPSEDIEAEVAMDLGRFALSQDRVGGAGVFEVLGSSQELRMDLVSSAT